MLEKGHVTKINSDLFTVECNNDYIDCKVRGKLKTSILVGDYVSFNRKLQIIESIYERKNYLQRPLVANIDIALIVTSIKEPNINLILLDKLISMVEINNIEPVIVLTKLDLDKKYNLKKLVNYYQKIGIKVFTNQKIRKLKKYLKNKTVTVCGQTGAGKTTLINKFNRNLSLKTKEISKSLGRGVHTTRIVSLYAIDNFYIVDTPGFSSIDINSFSKEEIKNSFREFRNITCQYKDCNHVKEKGCGIMEKVKEGTILKSRYDNYLRFLKESNY